MSKKAFDKIAEGLNEAIAVARDEATPTRLHVPTEIDVRGIRERTKLSQDAFAATYGFTLAQVRDWEQGRSRPLGGVRAYLMLIERNPREVVRLLSLSGSQPEGIRRRAPAQRVPAKIRA